MTRTDIGGLICGMAGEWAMLYVLARFEGIVIAISVAVAVTGLVIYNRATLEDK